MQKNSKKFFRLNAETRNITRVQEDKQAEKSIHQRNQSPGQRIKVNVDRAGKTHFFPLIFFFYFFNQICLSSRSLLHI